MIRFHVNIKRGIGEELVKQESLKDLAREYNKRATPVHQNTADYLIKMQAGTCQNKETKA